MPRILPVLTVAALAVALVGCAAGDAEPEAPDSSDAPVSQERECAAAGEGSDAVAVTGEFGTAPSVTMDAPLEVERTERTVVTEGDGEVADYGDTVVVNFSVYNGTTGEVATQTEYGAEGAAELILNEDAYLVGLVRTIECTTAGSRVVGVSPADEAFGDDGNEELGIAPGDTVVFVVDVLTVEGPLTPAEWTTDVPEVTRDADGIPTVTLPDGEMPTELQLAVLEEGDGATVVSGDSVTVDYQGISWDTGEIFDESFTSEPRTFSTLQVVEGFAAALVGQKVGSSVIVVIPPELAYGTDPAAHALGGQTLVFLIDIVAAGDS